MHEHVRNLRPAWIGFGWFIGVALTSLALFALTVLDLVRPDTPAEQVWVSVALVFGFALAGYFVGTRVAAAPILHGVAMGLFSLVAWAGLNLLAGEPVGVTAWDSLDAGSAFSLLSMQIAAAVIGARFGVRSMRRAEPS